MVETEWDSSMAMLGVAETDSAQRRLVNLFAQLTGERRERILADLEDHVTLSRPRCNARRKSRLTVSSRHRGGLTMLDARQFLVTLVDMPLVTIRDRKPNRVMRLEGDSVRVETDHSGAKGALIPILWVQQGIDVPYQDGELRINKKALGHKRTAFIGAALSQLRDVEVVLPDQRLRVIR